MILTVLALAAAAAPSTAPDPEAEARSFMESYARDLRAGDRAAVADRYSRAGVVFVDDEGRQTVPFDKVRARYLSEWTPPAAFAWRDLAVRPTGADTAEATGGFDWTTAKSPAPLRFAYRAELKREAGLLRIALEDERPVKAAAAVAPASAAGLPAQVKVVDGAFRTQTGDPLYTFRNDTMFGMSHCFGACAVAWPPLLAPSPAPPQPGPDWTLVTREPGVKQWAYKDKPLYRANVSVERVEAAVKDGMWMLAKPQ